MPPGRLIILRRSKSRAQTISSWKITSRAGARRISLLIAAQHAVRVGRLPDVHRDPFDGMLVAQNRVEELRLITHNRVLERYDLSAEGLPSIFRFKRRASESKPRRAKEWIRN